MLCTDFCVCKNKTCIVHAWTTQYSNRVYWFHGAGNIWCTFALMFVFISRFSIKVLQYRLRAFSSVRLSLNRTVILRCMEGMKMTLKTYLTWWFDGWNTRINSISESVIYTVASYKYSYFSAFVGVKTSTRSSIVFKEGIEPGSLCWEAISSVNLWASGTLVILTFFLQDIGLLHWLNLTWRNIQMVNFKNKHKQTKQQQRHKR